MKANGSILTKEERDVLLLAAAHPNGRHLNNTEIARRLGISVSKVKILIHQACAKLGARSRYDALISAVRQGELSMNEFFTLDELVELLSSLYPDGLRRIAQLIREGQENCHPSIEDEQIIRKDRRQDAILTKSERDVLGLVGRGLTNKEIADTLYISLNTVNTFLHRIYAKLGALNRADAWVLAAKRREISIGDIYSLSELLPFFTSLGVDTLEEIAQLMSEKIEQESVPTGS